MRIFITASNRFYDRVANIKSELESMGHKVTLPNGYEDSVKEIDTHKLSPSRYQRWKAEMIKTDGKIIGANDAILVLNFEKNGQKNYIGGAVFLEMFKAFDLGKKIFLFNPIPESMLKDEIIGLGPVIINGNLAKIK